MLVHKDTPWFSLAVNGAANSIIEFIEFPIGMQIVGVDIINEALGAGVTVAVSCGATILVAAVSKAAAGVSTTPIFPYLTTGTEKVTATIAGAAATGKLGIAVRYRAIGY
jgi:hypothetical protein